MSAVTQRRWACLISGQGSTLSAALSMIGEIDIRCVVSSKGRVAGLARARRAGVRTWVLPAKLAGPDWQKLTLDLRACGVNSLFLLGFLKILPQEFVQSWERKILNVHPSLLPAYPGLHAMEKSWTDQASLGVTLHWVTEGLDEGPRLFQKKVFSSGNAPQNFDQVRLHMAAAEQSLIRRACRLANMRGPL